ncbi:MAG: hypothetical protein KDA47_21405 [Planctomycetales bacterium]|nr:hypothetical protein [Planctomycetales bacterium]
MPRTRVTKKAFLEDRQGVKFVDVVKDPEQPFDCVLAFFNDEDRQRRMEESELHHDRAPLAGVVRELESLTEIDQFLAGMHSRRSTRLRQAIGVLVRMIMERRGWQKTGKKGSLGVRSTRTEGTPIHNSGGLAFWFVRAERYERLEGMPFLTVNERQRRYDSAPQHSGNGTRIARERIKR